MRVLAAIQTGGKATELGERLSQCALIAGRLRGPTQCFAGGPLVSGAAGGSGCPVGWRRVMSPHTPAVRLDR